MIDQILTEAGFIKNKTYKQTRFLTSPKQDFCVWHDQKTARGSDLDCRIVAHSITIELYTYDPASDAEERIENALSSHFPEWEKFDREWITDGQFYMTSYFFDYQEKL